MEVQLVWMRGLMHGCEQLLGQHTIFLVSMPERYTTLIGRDTLHAEASVYMLRPHGGTSCCSCQDFRAVRSTRPTAVPTIANGLTPYVISSAAASACPLMHAKCSGVRHLLSSSPAIFLRMSSTAVPYLASSFSCCWSIARTASAMECNTSAWPSFAAMCQAV